jgi:hypothetical protein
MLLAAGDDAGPVLIAPDKAVARGVALR